MSSNAGELVYEFDWSQFNQPSARVAESSFIELQRQLTDEREAHFRTKLELAMATVERDRAKIQATQYRRLSMRLAKHLDELMLIHGESLSADDLNLEFNEEDEL